MAEALYDICRSITYSEAHDTLPDPCPGRWPSTYSIEGYATFYQRHEVLDTISEVMRNITIARTVPDAEQGV